MKPAPEREIVPPHIEADLRKWGWGTPSNFSPWFGSWQPGAELTDQQIDGLLKRGFDPQTALRMDVFIQTSQAQVCAGLERKQPFRRIVCPIVSKAPDARGLLKVIAPIGDGKMVYPDGSLRKPWLYPRERVALARQG